MKKILVVLAGLLAGGALQAQVRPAPPHQKYMSALCISLGDALRTGPSRGLTSLTLGNMRSEYQRECSDNESEAMQRYSRERQDASAREAADRTAQVEAQQKARLSQQQCAEMKRILGTKKARTDLNEGERNDLRRFEENYIARCT